MANHGEVRVGGAARRRAIGDARGVAPGLGFGLGDPHRPEAVRADGVENVGGDFEAEDAVWIDVGDVGRDS